MVESISKKYIKNLLKNRPKDAHKGIFGKVLIVAGSHGMTGAAVLAARAALRAGAGLVRVCIDKELFPIIQIGVPEATCVPRNMGQSVLEEYDAIVIGPGIGTENEGKFTVAKLMENYGGNVVMDADALNVVAENNVDLRKAKANLIITPHAGEASRLINASAEDVNKNREKVVSYLSDITDSVTILKGHNTLVSLPREEDSAVNKIYENSTGNPGMATGGSGDVLSGIIGGLLAQGMNREDAAISGVYIHGLAGDLARSEFGEYGLIAGDIVKYVAYAILDIQKS